MDQPTMTVEIDEAIRRDPELLADVEAATEFLDTLPDETEPPAGAVWTLAANQPDRADQRPAVTLRLIDLPAYESVEVTSPPITRSRTRGVDYRNQAIRYLWTALLQKRSKVLSERLNAIILHGDWGSDDADQ